MRKMWKRLMALLCVSVMVLSGFSALAAETPATDTHFDVSGSKTADPTELACPDRKTTVTLSLPSAEYQNEIDIVFAVDSSSSSENGDVFVDSVNSLFNSILANNPNIKIKVGVVVFCGRGNDGLDYFSNGAYKKLAVYSDDIKEYIENALNVKGYFMDQLGYTAPLSSAQSTAVKNKIKDAFGSGSNTHGGIDIANEWLKEDDTIDDDHKYLVLLTDGKTYIWNDADHQPTTIHAQYYTGNSYKLEGSGLPQVGQKIPYNKYAYPIDVKDPSGRSNIFVFNTMEELYASTDPELTGVSTWDQPCRYADADSSGGGTPTGTVVKHDVTNGEELFGGKGDYRYWFEYTPDDAWNGLKYLEGNPYAVIDNGDGTYTFDTETINPNYYQYHVDPLTKGIYMAAHLWSDVNKKYNCAVITYSGGSNDGFRAVRMR